jgi:hypothetical protein
VLCSRCSTNLPDGSTFCLKCGRRVDLATDSVAIAAPPGESACGKCGRSLPRAADFCLNCGAPVISAANSETRAPVLDAGRSIRPPLRAQWLGLFVLGLLVLGLLGALLWTATSKSPAALQVQEFVSWSHGQAIIDDSVSVKAGSFAAFTFTVPTGALDISITGEFSSVADTARGNGHGSKQNGKNDDAGIEAYVLADNAFAVWSSGYSAESQYESGSVTSTTINAALPAGAGVYHLVFSNKNSPRAKTVHATVLMRYKSWLPDAVVRLKERFWNWLGGLY